MRCQLSLVDKFLKELFYRFGKFIGEQPGYFLIVPLLITALCASGFQRIQHEANPEYLFSPEQCPPICCCDQQPGKPAWPTGPGGVEGAEVGGEVSLQDVPLGLGRAILWTEQIFRVGLMLDSLETRGAQGSD